MQKATSEKAVTMISGLLSKLESKADILGLALGAYQLLASYGGGDAIKAGSDVLRGVATNPHVPNFGKVLAQLVDTRAEGQFFIPALQAAVGGYVLKELNIHPDLTRIGKLLQKGGVGAAKGIAAVTLVTYAGVANSPNPLQTNMSGGSSSPGSNRIYG